MKKQNSYSRRSAMGLAAKASVGAALGGLLTACGGRNTGPACVNLDDLSMGDASMRKANNYTEASAQPDKNCLNCAFFKLDAASEGSPAASCGNCEIFTGPANKNGYCDSWSEIDPPA